MKIEPEQELRLLDLADNPIAQRGHREYQTAAHDAADSTCLSNDHSGSPVIAVVTRFVAAEFCSNTSIHLNSYLRFENG